MTSPAHLVAGDSHLFVPDGAHGAPGEFVRGMPMEEALRLAMPVARSVEFGRIGRALLAHLKRPLRFVRVEPDQYDINGNVFYLPQDCILAFHSAVDASNHGEPAPDWRPFSASPGSLQRMLKATRQGEPKRSTAVQLLLRVDRQLADSVKYASVSMAGVHYEPTVAAPRILTRQEDVFPSCFPGAHVRDEPCKSAGIDHRRPERAKHRRTADPALEQPSRAQSREDHAAVGRS
jgi:hypothetical protein